jgi:hypothetical protein
MYIVPFIKTNSGNTSTDKKMFPFQMVWVFLTDGGNGVWQTEEKEPTVEQVVQEYLLENGFHGTPYYSSKMDTLFYEVDPGLTQMKQFYMWNDFLSKGASIPEDIEIWRPFFFLGNTMEKKDEWGWKEFCGKLSLGTFGTATQLWEGIFTTACKE